MDLSEKDKVLRHSALSISIPVNSLDSNDLKFPNNRYKDAKTWVRKTCSSLFRYIPGVMHPHAKIIRKWNKVFILSCLLTGFVDSLFLFMQYVNQGNICVAINQNMTKVLIVLRTQANFVYLLHMLLKFRLAYVDPESRVLVDHPKRTALNYLSGYFVIDFFVVLPLSQVIMWLILQKVNGSSGENHAINNLQVAMIFQYMVMFCRVLPMLAGRSTSGFVFESWLAKFVFNLLGFVLFSHVVGSCWYLFALHSVKECLKYVSSEFGLFKYRYCGQETEQGRFKLDNSISWTDTGCFNGSDSDNGIYFRAVNLTTEASLPIRYLYSLFWGFQQISTLAGNQTPSVELFQVLFTMFITATGLVLFSLLIGNMQNFLQALGHMSLEC